MNKRNILLYQRNASIQRLCESNPQITQGMPEILAAIETFTSNNERVAGIFNQMAQPRTVLSNPRHTLSKALRETAMRMTEVGIIIGVRLADKDKEQMYRALKGDIIIGNQFNMHKTAMLVLQALQTEGTKVADLGVTAAHLTEFQEMVSNFGSLLDNTRDLFQQRLLNWSILKASLSENSQILRVQLLPFVKLQKRSYPDFFREFMLAVRLPKAGPTQKEEDETLYELIGTVSDSETGKAVSGAIVSILTLDLHTNSDADGTFLFEDVPAGTYTLQCSAAGYKVEQHKAVKVEDAMDSEYTFALLPLPAETENAA